MPTSPASTAWVTTLTGGERSRMSVDDLEVGAGGAHEGDKEGKEYSESKESGLAHDAEPGAVHGVVASVPHRGVEK